MINKIILILTLLVGCRISIFAQGSLSFLRLNADARTGGMGDAAMGESTGMYIYASPTSFLQKKDKIYASYTCGILPKVDDKRLIFHAVSTGYKKGRQAVLVGFRYFGGLEIAEITQSGNFGKTIKPYDYSVDLTYTRNLWHNFSAYLTASFIQSYIGKTAYTGSGSGGIYYRNTLSRKKINYAVGAGFYDIGGIVKYGDYEYDQPASIGLGGSFDMELIKEHRINMVWTARYFVLPSDATEFTGGLGLEYQLFKGIDIRTGYYFEDANSRATVGLGYRMKNFHVDVAYKIATETDVENSLFLGCSVTF